ncbi:MAG: sugar kinase [Phycisphaerae bacterium]|nr:sugar kinase [Phycisphaerae bacterium]
MTSRKKAVFFGELLMRLATKRHERFVQAEELTVGYTGAEANAAVSLVNFGMDAHVVSSVPDNEIGQACVNWIRRFGVNTDYVKRGGRRLGTFYLETGASQRPSKVIYDRAGSSITELQVGEIDWDTVFQGKDWFHFCGTAPALGENVAEVVKEGCERAKEHGLTVSCDLNYRKTLWPPDRAGRVMTGLMEFVDVLIANEEHSRELFGITRRCQEPSTKKVPDTFFWDEDVARQLCARFGLRCGAITRRQGDSASDTVWSAVLCDGTSCYRGKEYRIHVVDRVGGGDAFSGALIYGLLSGMAPQETVDFAVAASCLKHSVHGDFNLVSLDEVRALMAGDAAGRVQR